MRNIAIITARSGSKGLEDKNIKLLGGKPLIAYTIEAAIESKCFDKVFVSTDSVIYATISERYGADAYPLRPKELSGNTVGSVAVIEQVLKENEGYTTFCLLQPTSPFRTAKDIVNAYNIYRRKKALSVVSMVASDKSPNIMNLLNSDGTITNFLKIDQKSYQRQNEKFYMPNGAIFISNCSNFLKISGFYGEKSYPYIMGKKESLDIDDKYDFMLAELIKEEEQ